MRIVLHFGAHKTASTHLQYNLTLNKPLLEKEGIKYFRFHDVKHLRRHAIYLRRHPKDQKTARAIKEIIQKETAGYQAAIISYEGILGDLKRPTHEVIYPRAEEMIAIYKAFFREHRVIPVFAGRNYQGFLRSSYKELIKTTTTTLSLDQYLQQKTGALRWTEIVSLLDKNFESQVYFYTLESYKNNWKSILYEIIRLSGKTMDFQKIKFDSQRKNTTKGSAELDFYYTINQIFRKIPYTKYKGAALKRIKKYFPPLFYKNRLIAPFLRHCQNDSRSFPKKPSISYQKEVHALQKEYGFFDAKSLKL